LVIWLCADVALLDWTEHINYCLFDVSRKELGLVYIYISLLLVATCKREKHKKVSYGGAKAETFVDVQCMD